MISSSSIFVLGWRCTIRSIAAYTKLIWVLGHTRNVEEVKKLTQTSIAGEITAREGPRGFVLLQGIEPGIDEILKHL